jgi:hypothetical protein
MPIVVLPFLVLLERPRLRNPAAFRSRVFDSRNGVSRFSGMSVSSPNVCSTIAISLDRLFRLYDHRSPAANQDATMDIGGWLRSLGLERYEAAFRANAIEADVLHDLTDHLEKAWGVARPSCGQ